MSQILRVTYPRSEARLDGDDDWLRQLTERHGGRFPDTVMNSFPGKVDLWFPDAASEAAFRTSLHAEGRFSIEERQPFSDDAPSAAERGAVGPT